MNDITLYGYATSPFVRKTGCFLYYKGLEFTHVPVDPTNPQDAIGFTAQAQVPVLKIGTEWRLESSAHAYWLDELYPERPLCPVEHLEKISEIDDWISGTFLTSIFRYSIDGPKTLQFRHVAWRLAALISAHTPLSEKVRHEWPEMLKTAPFIQDMAEQMDLTESYSAMQLRILAELVEHIGEGPYLGALNQPTMLDFAVFPQMVYGFMFGLEERLSAAGHPVVKAWLQCVADHLPPNPTLIADEMQLNSLSSGLA